MEVGKEKSMQTKHNTGKKEKLKCTEIILNEKN